jgi:hypothetical protein
VGQGTNLNLAPEWIVGFTEGEGAFMITVRVWDGKPVEVLQMRCYLCGYKEPLDSEYWEKKAETVKVRAKA